MTEKDYFEGIQKEHILQAIERVNAEGYNPKRKSSQYDLVHNDVAYPPKYIVSLAGFFAKNHFIIHNRFKGGEDSLCFAFLHENGFTVLPKSETTEFEQAKTAKDINAKYLYKVLDEKLDQDKFKAHFEEYISYCKRNPWLSYREGYKFRFARWLSDKVDFDKQTDEEILQICIDSQEEEFDPGEKGINFILSAKRFQDEFISLVDIKNIRKIRTGALLEDDDLKQSTLSAPKLSVWAGTLLPEKVKVYSHEELTKGLPFLFEFDKYPSSGVRGINLATTCLNEIAQNAKEKYGSELLVLIQIIFPSSTEVRPVDLTWLVQDFMLFIIRRVLSRETNYFWVNQGDNYKVEMEHGIVAAPDHSKHHHRRLRELFEGDVIIHYANTAIRAISTVTKEFELKPRPYTTNGDLDLIVETNYEELESSISIKDIKNTFENKSDLLPKKYGPLTKDFGAVQAYMCAFNKDSYNMLFNQPNYWVFQGKPEVFDTVSAIKEGNLETWSVYAHKSKIKIGDKIILWVTGKESGCIALAEITSDLFNSEEFANEVQYYKDELNKGVKRDKVKIKITHDLTDSPILNSTLKDLPTFGNFKGGNQGTNFTATKEEYETILNAMGNKSNKKYWLFAPGEQAEEYEEFLSKGIMGLGWDELGNLLQYNDQEEIAEKLRQLDGSDGSKKNDSKANFDFANNISIGDVIIIKKGKKNLLGYGEVTSDYYFDEARTDYKSCRKVNWKLNGEWTVEFNFPVKTLTPITTYKSDHPDYDYWYQELLAIMGVLITKVKKDIKPINRILYGPPGTGKTYHLKTTLFPQYISKENSVSREDFISEIVNDLPWWKVIAMSVYKLKEAKVSDIRNQELILAKARLSSSKYVKQGIWNQLQSHTVDHCENVNVKQRQTPLFFYKNDDSSWTIDTEGFEQIEDEITGLIESIDSFERNPDKEIKRYEFVTFHQSYAYEDFIEGIKPVMGNETEGDIQYEIKDGIFKRLCQRAGNDPDNSYAIFIDEINRGNVSSIFGELITLIEDDKRIGSTNEMRATLPYSRQKDFGVPKNVHIYGTMNTADRSVEALDTALRRRFSFQERMPDPSVLENKVVEAIKLAELLSTINERIEVLVDRDHTIGHAYFINVEDIEDLRLAFKDKIIPLLQEYFYGDYGKIGLVLGEGFVENNEPKENLFTSFEYEGSDGLLQNSFDLIPFDEVDFKDALDKLMNK